MQINEQPPPSPHSAVLGSMLSGWFQTAMPDSLIMEHLDTNLHEFLKSTPDLLLTTKQSVLDVARGLLYLHYDTSLDDFSFADVILFMLTQQLPNLLAATYSDPNSDKVIGLTEMLESSLPNRLELEKKRATERRRNTFLKDNNKALQEQATSLQEMIVSKQGLVDEQLEELQKKDEQILALQGKLDQQREQVKTIEKKIDQLLM